MAMRRWLNAFRDEVVIVDEPVSLDLGVTRHLLQHPRRPVWLRNADGGQVAGNLWSTRDRVAASMKTRRDDLFDHLMAAMREPAAVRMQDTAPFMEDQSTDVDLGALPVPKFFPGDAGRYITAGVWVAEWEGKRNLSFHRILLLDGNRGAARIVPRHLMEMRRRALAAGQELKVAVCLGLNPWNLIGGGLSVGYDVDEMTVASALKQRTLGEPVNAVRLRSGLTVPVEADYVLEGRLIDETHAEGPFVDAVLTYDRVRPGPVVVFDRVYQVKEPVFHAIVGGSDEHYMFMGMPREPVIYEAVNRVVPVKAVRLSEGGCAWLHGMVSIRKRREEDGKAAIAAAFEAHRSMKHVTVVDDDVDVFDDREVEWAVATRFQADKGLVVLPRQRGSSIDPSAEDVVEDGVAYSYTAKMGLDATKPVAAGAEFAKARLDVVPENRH